MLNIASERLRARQTSMITLVGGGAKQPPGFTLLKYCRNIIGVRTMLIYFRLHC